MVSGITEHDENARPNIRIFNTPNIGRYGNDPIEYSTKYDYDSTLKKWKVQVISTDDMFDDYVASTGLYPISIYVEDGLTSHATNDEYVILVILIFRYIFI